MPHIMKSTNDALSFSIEGIQYNCDENGLVEVADEHMSAAAAHGFRKADGEEARLALRSSTITPAMIMVMTRDQLMDFFAVREIEVPPNTSTSQLRGRAIQTADDEADERAAAGPGNEPKPEPVKEPEDEAPAKKEPADPAPKETGGAGAIEETKAPREKIEKK